MAPSTRNTNRDTPLPDGVLRKESDTIKKLRFFNAYDKRSADESQSSISRDIGVSQTTGSRWLQERRILGSPAYGRSRNRSLKLGPRLKVTDEQL